MSIGSGLPSVEDEEECDESKVCSSSGNVSSEEAEDDVSDKESKESSSESEEEALESYV